MRRFEESQKSDFERYVKLGYDNAECLRQMRSWCKHAEINRVSGGLYAQITGLPIASHSISCPYVEGESQSMNLRWIFSDFLVQNCAGCPHHTPNGNTSWGQKIIDDHREETQKREQVTKEKADRISQLRSDLRLKSRNMSTEAEPESHRILEFLEAVFSEDEAVRNGAAERLKQSARLGPDLFPDAAIDLVLILAGSDEFCALMLPVCAELASRRPDLGARLSKTALDNIEKGLHSELAASVLVALGNAVAFPLDGACIERLLLSQDHYRPIGGWEDDGPDYSHSTAILVRSFDAEPLSVQSVIRRELHNENDYVRVQLCGAVKLIQEKRPQIVVTLLDDLVRSLELYEDERLGTQTPSGQIIHILQAAFRHSPEVVDQFLAGSMARVRPTVQEDIIRVYRDQFFDRTEGWEERREQRNRAEVSECEKAAIQRLLTWAKDDRLEIDIRAHALEALEIACKYATLGALNHFDSLLGYFAIVSGEKRLPDAPPKILLPGQPPEPQLVQLNEFSRTQQWQIFKQRLQKCLKELCEARPSEVVDSVSGCLSQPLEDLEDGFKACCVSLLGKIGKDYQLQPRVLPQIWRALMDYGSALVRARAIDATVEMFSYSSGSPPANLVDTIIVHLRDPKVVVHKAALRAVSRCPRWFDERQSDEVLTCLSSHLHAYRDDKYQLDDICEGILAISRHHERLKVSALRMVKSIFPTGEELVDSKIAENLMWFCKPGERISWLVAKEIATYLGLHQPDRLNSYRYSPRERMFECLHELPAGAYQRAAEDLLSSARRLAERDAWESCHFASLFAHYRAFRYEQIVLETTANALPEEPRHESFRGGLRQLAMVAAGNAFLQVGNTAAAETCFVQGKSRA
jgi:hypothetical protein